MNVADWVLVAVLVIGTSFALFLSWGSAQNYRGSDGETWRGVLTRGAPIALLGLALPISGAIAGGLTGAGLSIGALVAIACFIVLLVPLTLAALMFEIVRGVVRER